MNEIAGAWALGVVAGLALAMPVGPVSLLLLQEGLARGFRVAAWAAIGVATVDTTYAMIATVAGGGVTRLLGGREPVLRAVSAAALLLVAAVGLRRTLVRPPAETAHMAGLNTCETAMCAVSAGRGESGRAFGRFVGVTAINPLTALAFASVALALAPRVEGGGRAAFVVGVLCASGAWQLTLAAIGSTLRSRLGARARVRLSIVGHRAVVVLAAVVALA